MIYLLLRDAEYLRRPWGLSLRNGAKTPRDTSSDAAASDVLARCCFAILRDMSYQIRPFAGDEYAHADKMPRNERIFCRARSRYGV